MHVSASTPRQCSFVTHLQSGAKILETVFAAPLPPKTML